LTSSVVLRRMRVTCTWEVWSYQSKWTGLTDKLNLAVLTHRAMTWRHVLPPLEWWYVFCQILHIPEHSKYLSSHLASFNMYPATVHCGPSVDVRQTLAHNSDTKQTMSEEKSGLIETGLTSWLVAPALGYYGNTHETHCTDFFHVPLYKTMTNLI